MINFSIPRSTCVEAIGLQFFNCVIDLNIFTSLQTTPHWVPRPRRRIEKRKRRDEARKVDKMTVRTMKWLLPDQQWIHQWGNSLKGYSYLMRRARRLRKWRLQKTIDSQHWTRTLMRESSSYNVATYVLVLVIIIFMNACMYTVCVHKYKNYSLNILVRF